ncbi:fimbrial assembly protein, partial [Enterobacter cloacae]|uniref:fimbria/pilus outer membrane usher protein n=1 Tax=Enterobacter sp. 148H3 TaxID=3077756 RepID=UPI000DCC537A
YSTGYTLSQSTGNTKDDHQFSFNIQVPLSDFLPSSWASYSMSSGSNGKTSHRAGVSGTLLQENNLNYSIYQNYITQGEGYGTDMYATYRGSYGTVNGGYSNGQGSRHVNYGLQGSIVAHPYGITFGQSLGESMALVKARGAKGIKVVNSPGVHTDWRGYAIVPYLSAYQINRIGLDTQSMGSDVDVKENITSVIPTKGSLVLANYHTRIGSRVLFKFNSKGIAVPFGATVSLSQDDDTSNTSIVGNDGEVYLSGVPETGKLIARWGRNSYEQCSANFNLNKKDDSAVKELSVACY